MNRYRGNYIYGRVRIDMKQTRGLTRAIKSKELVNKKSFEFCMSNRSTCGFRFESRGSNEISDPEINFDCVFRGTGF